MIESPVCTPIGSKFSIEQMITTVVRAVAHHLHLEFFPAEERFFDQDFVTGEAPGRARRFLQILAIVGDAAAGAAEGEAGRMMSGKLPIASATRCASAMECAMPRARNVEADPQHRFFEQLAVFRLSRSPGHWRRSVGHYVVRERRCRFSSMRRSTRSGRPAWAEWRQAFPVR